MRSLVNIKEKPKSIELKWRLNNGKLEYEEIPFNNYFYIDIKDFDEVEKLLKNKDVKYENDGLYLKIILLNNYDRKEIVNLIHSYDIKTYEADLNSAKRYLIDNDIKINAEGLKWCMYDIETLDLGKLEKDQYGKIIATTPVLSIAYIDYKGNKCYIKNENEKNPIEGEKELLRTHLRIIQNYDILLGWNSRGFDDPYIIQRCQHHGIDERIMYEINRMDYMQIVEKNAYPKPESMSLDNVSKELLGFQKVEIGQKGKGVIYKLWQNSFDEEESDFDELIKKYNTDNEEVSLKSYNFKDTYLMYLIEQKYEFLKVHQTLSNMVGCLIEDTVNNSTIWDFILLKEYNKLGIKSPTKYSFKTDGKEYIFNMILDDDLKSYKFDCNIK